MHKYIFILSVLTICGSSYELDNLRGKPIEQCINCICYAKTGSSDIHLCGRQVLTRRYWKTAGSLSTSCECNPEFARQSCIEDVNCILNTIKRYTEQFGAMDCNMDRKFDCQDRFGVHVWRNQCVNRRIAPIFYNRLHSCLPDVFELENRSGNNRNRDQTSQNFLLQQTVNGGTRNAEQHLAVVTSQTSGGNAMQGVNGVVQHNTYSDLIISQ